MSVRMGIQKLLSLSLVGMAMAISSQVSAGTIKGSAHDFSVGANGTGTGWSTQICLACHTPHNASNAQGAPLWGHDTTAATFTTYKGILTTAGAQTTMQATTVNPTGTSLLCLSCHDGTLALDSFGGVGGTPGGAGAGFINGGVAGRTNLGVNLSNDHPISFDYTTALATADGALFDPSTALSNKLGKTGTTAVASGRTIAEDLLEGGTRMECSSCHDVHNTFTGSAPTAASIAKGGSRTNSLLKVSIANSLLCLTCHNK